MRILVAGASGAVGRRLVPMLVAHGHDVVGTTRTSSKAAALAATGALAAGAVTAIPAGVRLLAPATELTFNGLVAETLGPWLMRVALLAAMAAAAGWALIGVVVPFAIALALGATSGDGGPAILLLLLLRLLVGREELGWRLRPRPIQ